MTPDGELLRRYAENRSEDAFSELVRRHLDLVYSAALRQVNGDAHLAQDVAQTVFTDLARKAAALSGRAVLSGWLYTSAHFASAKAVRTERRRQAHEQEAHIMRELLGDPAPDLDWEKLRSMLDVAMHELGETDRDAILLRYFENRQLAEIGARLGLSENAARMRVERALGKLRAFLSRRGIRTSTALAAVLSANAVQAAPVGLAITISTAAALAGTAIATTATAAKAIAMTTLQKTLITASALAAIGMGIYEARQVSWLRGEIRALRQRQAPFTEQIQLLQRARDDATRQLTTLRDENERLNRNTTQLLKLRGEVARLRRDSQELAQLKTSATQGSGKAGDSKVTVSYGLPAPTPRGLQQRLALEQLARMKAKFNLSGDQERAISEAMSRRVEFNSQRVWNDVEEKIKALLTAEQLAAYPEYQREEAAIRVGKAVTAEVSEMTNELNLTKEQQEALSAILTDLYSKWPALAAEITRGQDLNDIAVADRWSRHIEIAKQRLDETLKALEGVLTPEQFETYREDQMARLDLMKRTKPSLPSESGGRTGSPD